MRPQENVRVWRKSLRAASKSMRRGRRTTHRVYVTGPSGPAWLDRHRGWDAYAYYRDNVGKRRVPAEIAEHAS